MTIKDVLQKIDDLIELHEACMGLDSQDYHEGALDVLEELRDAIQEGGEEMADTIETERTDLLTPSKSEVKYIYEQACFGCKWSSVDPFDWGLRCCYDKSEHCTEYCPDEPCEHFEEEKYEGDEG